eukprot:CAMPEP_0194743526 /NCGR_PEP_ID=MMETSP0296-20130528/100356_1 /TAXON_ID=39354 /ORGANISM="Heterosigma akashiwo, Strain CCMP2393" /LENGTH=525 /DNA_ID=CAMNT_0039655557 /DNA_START=121 /DNA_END=1699 /DNA_ORIENTATION=+
MAATVPTEEHSSENPESSNNEDEDVQVRAIKGWQLYDWAESATVLAFNYFIPVYVNEAGRRRGWAAGGKALWAYLTAGATLLTLALFLTVTGAAEYGGLKRAMLRRCTQLGAASMILMLASATPKYIWVVSILFIVSKVLNRVSGVAHAALLDPLCRGGGGGGGGRLLVLNSAANSEESDADLETMGGRLAEDVRRFVLNQCPELFSQANQEAKLSFIAHSAGGLIVRAALARPEMRMVHPKLHAFVTLSTPHLGNAVGTSGLVGAGMRALDLFSPKLGKPPGLLKQLLLQDAPRHKAGEAFLCRLASAPGPGAFRHVVLVAAEGDEYVPRASALAQRSPELIGAGGAAAAAGLTVTGAAEYGGLKRAMLRRCTQLGAASMILMLASATPKYIWVVSILFIVSKVLNRVSGVAHAALLDPLCRGGGGGGGGRAKEDNNNVHRVAAQAYMLGYAAMLVYTFLAGGAFTIWLPSYFERENSSAYEEATTTTSADNESGDSSGQTTFIWLEYFALLPWLDYGGWASAC